MITRFANLTSRLTIALVFLFGIAACGGGGGSGGGGFLGEGDGNDTDAYTLSLALYDAQNNETNTVTSTAPVKLEVTVTTNGGKAVANKKVTATTTIGVIAPESGTALTNDNGVATFQIESDAGKGAGTITATIDSEEGAFSGSKDFQVGNTGLRLGYFDEDGSFIENEISIAPQSALTSAGRAQISLAIVNKNSQLVGTTESVRFSSGCLSSGQAKLDPGSPLVSGDGIISTTYTATGCSGVDEISASLVGAVAQAFGSVSIASPKATGLTFVSASPETIVLRGTGGGLDQQESSAVIFKVVDRNGSPVQGVNVNFSLTTEVGGLTVSPDSALSASDGTVGVTVFSGDVATVVRVIASTAADDGTNEQVATVSNVLTVTTGLPDQDSISLSVAGGYVVENGMTMDGVERVLTVKMGDTFNNLAPNGTAAVFTTEYGNIDPSCETGVKNGIRLLPSAPPPEGECSVLWTSGNPRGPTLEENQSGLKTIYSPGYKCPSHNGNSGPCPDDLGYTRGGRSTILVTAIGQESFVDANGNGIMDQDEQDRFANLPEAFLDHNEDRAYTPDLATCQGSGAESAQCVAGFEEKFKDFNSNGAYDLNDDPAVYNGLLCPPEGDGVWCSRGLVNVRDDIVLTLSYATEWDIILVKESNGSVASGTREGVPYIAYISDAFNSMPPEGSKVSVSTGGGCELISEPEFTVPSSYFQGAFGVLVQTDGDGSSGTLTIKLEPVDGTEYSETFSCSSIATDPNAPLDCGFSPKPPGCP